MCIFVCLFILPCVPSLNALYVLCKALSIALLLKGGIQINLPCLAQWPFDLTLPLKNRNLPAKPFNRFSLWQESFIRRFKDAQQKEMCVFSECGVIMSLRMQSHRNL